MGKCIDDHERQNSKCNRCTFHGMLICRMLLHYSTLRRFVFFFGTFSFLHFVFMCVILRVNHQLSISCQKQGCAADATE